MTPSRVLFVVALSVLPWHLAQAEEPVDFNRDIRPILSNKCFYCHGPDAGTREADLRLDVREAAVDYGAIVPEDVEASLLVERILSDDPDMVMPPPAAKKTLSPQEKELLQRWIAEGAPYAGHWAFEPVRDPPPPEVQNSVWARNDVDRFILAELEAHKLTPSPEADRATLIRRASLDLTGLLPTPADVEAFVQDARPDAYEQMIERLLASPHYGERWGRHWLDQARYADSNGYTIDSERAIWPYRDWVIRALNEDMPFDRFTIEQLAGDLLPNPTKLQRVATAFHRNTMINEEGGTDAEQFRNEIVVDRVNTTGAVWLGLTLGCAQCHTHKFDPISHREYFEMFAFFNHDSDVNNKGATIDVLPGDVLGTPSTTPEQFAALKAARATLDSLKKSSGQRQTDWEKRVLQSEAASPDWAAIEIENYSSLSNRTLRKLDDGSILADREGAANDTYEIVGAAPLEQIEVLRLSVLPHESLLKGGAGTAGNGNFVLTEIELLIDNEPVALAHALADHEKKANPVAGAIDGQKKTGWALEMGQGGKGEHQAWFYLREPIDVRGKKLTVRLRHDVNDHYLIGRFSLSALPTAPLAHPDAKLWEQAVGALKKEGAKRSESETALIKRVFTDTDRDLAMATREHDALDRTTADAATMLVMQPAEKARETFIHLRGDFLNLDKETGVLSADTLDCLPPLNPQGEQPGRLDLARWLVRSDQPLTPRVTVNRVWMQYFGVGLVETENDFGTQGSPPTHPELLDWLASQLVKNGWSMKSLHRLIVTSATYRQSSRHRPELMDVDARNLLLARQNRLRVDAEVVRDAGLSASGLLDRTLGGPTVRPPQPEGVYAFTQNKKQWNESQGKDRYRRAMYTTFYRSAPYPLFTTFDAPNFSTVCTRRVRSNTPLQALTVANDVAFIEMAQGLAGRLWKEVPAPGDEGDQSRAKLAFRLCYSREPSAYELNLLLAFLGQQQEKFAADPAGAAAAAPKQRPSGMNEAVAAAWSALARGLMNTDEFITRE